MPPTPTVAAANDALRAYVRAHGGRSWSRRELEELARLRDAYLVAVRAGLVEAA